VTAQVEVVGGRELRRRMRQLEVDTADLKDANATVAATVAVAAAARAPRRSGRLASTGRGNRAAGRAVVTFGGAAAPYAAPIHYGWPARGIEGDPFVADAAQDTEPQWLSVYEAAIQRLVDAVT
jgi:hypothetical protein